MCTVCYIRNRDRFLKNNSGNAEFERQSASGARARGGGLWGGGVPSPPEDGAGEGASVPLPRHFFDFWILNRPNWRILVQTECFLYSSPKADLNAVGPIS